MKRSDKITFNGFTLIESIMVVAIFTIMILATTEFIVQSYRNYHYDLEQMESINEARRGVETAIREIRQAKIADDGSYPIELADDNQLIFYSDIDADGETERIRYFLDGNTFKKGIIKPTGSPISYPSSQEQIEIISRYINNPTSSPIFTYYNGDWPQDTINNPLPTATRLKDTKLIHFHLVININPARAPSNFNLESDVQIRNLKTNL